jgi:hypothetical protein
MENPKIKVSQGRQEKTYYPEEITGKLFWRRKDK